MRTLSTLTIGMFFALALSFSALGQQSGGLRIMEPAEEGICREESVSAETAQKNARKLAELARELTAMLKRTAEIQKKLAGGAGKDVRAELSRMIERTTRMTAELEKMAEGKNP